MLMYSGHNYFSSPGSVFFHYRKLSDKPYRRACVLLANSKFFRVKLIFDLWPTFNFEIRLFSVVRVYLFSSSRFFSLLVLNPVDMNDEKKKVKDLETSSYLEYTTYKHYEGFHSIFCNHPFLTTELFLLT